MTVTFSDLPMDVLEKVVGKSDLQECLVLRKVCRDLRNLVDSSEINCEEIGFDFVTSCVVKFGNMTLVYMKSEDGGCEVTVYKEGTKKEKTYRDVRNHEQVMIADLSTFLGNPKLKVDHIEFNGWFLEDMKEFLDYLKSLHFLLHARTIHSSEGLSITPILPFLKPDVLEEITIEGEMGDNEVNEIAGMEQWKKKTRIRNCFISKRIGLEKFVGFKEFCLHIWFSTKDPIKLRDILLNSPHLEYCELFNWWYKMTEEDVFPLFEFVLIDEPAYDPSIRRFLIPNSRDYFQLKLKECRGDDWTYLSITKVSNN